MPFRDPVDAVDRIAGETLAQRLDDGNAAGDRRLERQRDVLLLGERREFEAMRGEQRLVRGDDGLAMRQRRFDADPRRTLGAADQLDEKVDVGRSRQRHGVGEKRAAADLGVALLVGIAHRHGRHDDLAAGARGERVRLSRQEPRDGSANRADTGDADAQCFRHGYLS